MTHMFRIEQPQPTTQVGRLVQDLKTNSPNIAPSLTGAALSMESRNASDVQQLSAVAQDLESTIRNIAAENNIELTPAMVNAGIAAGMMGADWMKFMRSEKRPVDVRSNAILDTAGADGFASRSFGMEAYSERENTNASVFSIAYNLGAAKQNAFGEAHFPTITLSPELAGLEIKVPLFQVYKAVRHEVSGDLTEFARRNLIRASVDHTILEKERTRIVPVYRPEAADKFVDPTLIAPYDYDREGEKIKTAPLAIGKDINIIGLSATDLLLQSGTLNQTDTLEASLVINAIYVKVGDDVIKFKTKIVPTFNFLRSSQGSQRQMTLTANTNSILLNKATTTVSGSPLTTLASVVTDDLVIRLEVALSGSAMLDKGDLKVFGNTFRAYTVSQNKTLLDKDAAPAKPVVDLLATAQIIGYDIDAWLSNENRRQQGQLIDTNYWRQTYIVPYRAPISAMYPTTEDETRDASDIQTLIATTRTRLENEAVTMVLETAEQLSEFVDARDHLDSSPDVLGVGRWFVRPTFFYEKLKMMDIINTLTSTNLKEDLQAAIVNKCRDYVYRAWRDSDYIPASEALGGGMAKTPEVTIGTEPVLERYLTVTGDLRTLGGSFDCRVVSTVDQRMRGKIIITFSQYDANRNVAPHPLNFGNLIWAPELTLSAAITRDGQLSRETVVQPRYLFMVNCPIMIVLEVEDIEDVMNKIPLHVKTI